MPSERGSQAAVRLHSLGLTTEADGLSVASPPAIANITSDVDGIQQARTVVLALRTNDVPRDDAFTNTPEPRHVVVRPVSSDEWVDLMHRLCKSPRLQVLYCIGHRLDSLVCAEALCETVAQAPRLEVLHLQSNGLGSTTTAMLASVLADHISLVAVRLRNNGLTDDDAHVLSVALDCNRSLLEVDLSHNRVGDPGAIRLAKALCSDSPHDYGDWGRGTAVPVELIVSEHNDGPCEVCTELLTPSGRPIRSLQCGHTFHTLCLFWWFGTSEQRACPLCKATEPHGNNTLQVLNLSHNRVGFDGVLALSVATQPPNALVQLIVDDRDASPHHDVF